MVTSTWGTLKMVKDGVNPELAGIMVPVYVLKAVTATVLITFGCYRLWRHRHPRCGGMQVGFRDLTAWSFLMASAHGAGFLVLPRVIMMPADVSAATGGHASHAIAGWPSHTNRVIGRDTVK